MKYFCAFLFAFFLASCVACSSAPPTLRYIPPEAVELVPQLEDATVALRMQDEGGGTRVFCSGVWVGFDRILTAAHCAQAAMPETATNEIGVRILYHTRQESNGAFQEPKALHIAVVQRIDAAHDLALLWTESFTPWHDTARLEPHAPWLTAGEDLYLVGHPSGVEWTYMHGYIAGYQGVDFAKEVDKVGPWLQVSAPVWFGNSGGGAFDETGALVGIASFIIPSTPAMAFYVHRDTIQAFLQGKT